ncbi:ABC transporter permease [Paenibacillus montaniterrae]|uniref:ABC transporter permease n=1 Tax=Paenibacillus montaniterrae TaxID=429341 RepID=A0A919YSH5_9BACL|nr:ABC transporter permease [Paenibacillus montaniterrae]GIP17581.1 ABC transporter permease [Paenibacillus montaniterrae]
MRSAAEEATMIVRQEVRQKQREDKLLVKLKLKFSESIYLPPAAAFIALFLLWEAAVRLLNVNPVTLPAPTAVVRELVGSIAFYLPHAWVTLYEALLGFFLGMAVAITAGIFMAHSRLLERMLLPIAILANVTPIMAIAPLFILWFGFDALPKVLIAAIITFFPMLINSIMGFRSIDENHLEYMNSLHASKREIFTKLRLPNSLPYLFSAARTCVSLSVMGAVVGEWSGSTEGLGNIIMMSSNYMQTERMFSAIFMLAIMGICLTNIVRFIEIKLLSWHVSSNRGI